MREILFKAKAANREKGRSYRTRYKNGDWVYGLLTDPKNYLGFAEMTNTNGVSGIEVDPETVCQWTGLVDKNGVKIFEVDILHSDYGENYKVFYTTKSCSFMAECIQGNAPMLGNYRMGECWSNTIAVIGNIHDQKEETP